MPDIDVNYLSEAINDKADRDIMNLTNSGYAKGSGLSMPSSRYIDLTLGASGSTYTAPANGWFYVNKKTGGTNQYIDIESGNMFIQDSKNASGSNLTLINPITKGTVAKITYNASGVTVAFRFIYAEGEEVN